MKTFTISSVQASKKCKTISNKIPLVDSITDPLVQANGRSDGFKQPLIHLLEANCDTKRHAVA